MRERGLFAGLLFVVAGYSAHVSAQVGGPGTYRAFKGNYGDIAAADGVWCKTRFGIGGQYPDDGLQCDSKDDAWILPHMTDAATLAVGDGGRAWIVRNTTHEVVVDIDGSAHVFAPLPEAGNAIDLLLWGATTMVQIDGIDVAVDHPLVRMESGHVYWWGYEADSQTQVGWNLFTASGGDETGAQWSYSEFVGAWPSYKEAFSANLFGLLTADGFVVEMTPFIVPLRRALPSKPELITSLSGLKRWSVADHRMLSEGIRDLMVLQSAEPFEWSDLIDHSNCLSDFPTPGEVTCFPFVPLPQSAQETFVYRFVGGSFGLTPQMFGMYPANAHVEGFMITENVRTYAIIDVPPLEPPTGCTGPDCRWVNSYNQMRSWRRDSGIDPNLVEVDPIGGPIYQLPPQWTEIPSVALPTYSLPPTREKIALDVYVPSSASGWLGDIQMSAQVPAAGVWDTYLGYRSLAGLPRNQWVEIEFDLPASVRQALQGDYPAALIRTVTNTSASGIRIRGLRVSGNPPAAPRAPHAPLLSGVRTSSFLDFEEPGDWLGVGTEFNLGRASSGLGSIRINVASWSEVESRTFSTSELPHVGQRLALDVFVPSPSPNPYWGGSVGVYLTCPSKGFWGQYLGQRELTNLFAEEWNTVTFPLSSAAIGVLQSGAMDCSLRVALSTPDGPAPAGFLLDHFGFLE